MITANQKRGLANGAVPARSVFLSHPARTDTSVIRRILEEEGVSILSAEQIETGESVRAHLVGAVQKVDALIAVIGEPSKSTNVFYQMGLADAMGKPVLIISVRESDPTSDQALYPYLRTRPDDEEALRFGLTHFIRAPHHRSKSDRDSLATTKPIGKLVDGFLARLHSGQSIKEDELINIIATAIRESGVDTQASVPHRASYEEIPADIAVWSDELDSVVGNPLPIEVRSSLLTAHAAESAAKNLMRSIAGAKARRGLILFLKASANAMEVLNKYPVLAMSIEDFLEGMRTRSFGNIITDLRNQAVHGVRADA
jgi:hypothetical protein